MDPDQAVHRPTRPARLHRAVRRAVLRRRRLLAALLIAAAVAAGLRAVAGPPPQTEPVWVAAHDLPAGRVVAGDDLVRREFPADAVPAGLVADAAGGVLAGPLRRGEPVTDARLVRGTLAASYPGLAAMPIRIPDAAAVRLLAAGDRIDLIATDPQGGGSRVLMESTPVLAIPPPAPGADPVGGPGGGRLIVLGVEPELRDELADAAVLSFLSFSLTS